MTLDDLVRRLREVHGDALNCVALYGSAARGGAEHIAKKSDYNVLVIVSSLSMEALRREAPVARAWRDAGNPPPLTLSLSEWTRCADIFPMEYADILQYNRVLHGALPLDGIRIDSQHLRLQLENEAMGKLLRLRHHILLAGDDGSAQREILEGSISTILTLFRAYARLHNATPPADSEALVTDVAEHVGFDKTPFARVLQHLKGTAKLSEQEIGPTLAAYLTAVQTFVAHVDQYPLPTEL
jgi:predicted nucleotidyltransferase